MPIGANFADIRHFADVRSPELVTPSTVMAIKKRTVLSTILINRIGIRRRLQRVEKPVFDSLNGLDVYCGWCNSGTQRSTLVTLGEQIIVAVPMQMHSNAGFLVPDRGK